MAKSISTMAALWLSYGGGGGGSPAGNGGDGQANYRKCVPYGLRALPAISQTRRNLVRNLPAQQHRPLGPGLTTRGACRC